MKAERLHSIGLVLVTLVLSAAVAQEKAVSEAEYQSVPGSTVGCVRISGWVGGEQFIAAFDTAINRARYDDGLILDLRGCGGGDSSTVAQAMGRLTNAVLRTTPEIRPRGPWQFDLPVVILVDETTAPPTDFLIRAARQRSQMESVGRATIADKRMQPGYVITDDMYETMRHWQPDKDPVFEKGLDELYRMIGRLQWLQDERRKEILSDTAHFPRPRR
jgi:hypothetical protein